MAVTRAAVVAFTAVTLLMVPVGAGAVSVSGTVGSGGNVALVLEGTDPNGSVLRYAMDGNFAPLVDSLPINTTEQGTILAAISVDESGLAGSLLFGNRDGTVEANEVTMFETLIQDAGTAFSLAGVSTTSLSFTGALALTLDGARASSTTLGGIAFTGAVGPDSSPAPIGIDVTLNLQFPAGGSSHTLALGTNITGLGLGLSLVAPSVLVNLTLPSGTAVTGTTGFTSTSTTADPWGWSSPTVSGTYSPGTSANISVSYGPAFPTGYALALGIPVAGAAGLIGFLLIRRRRRRRAAATPAPTAPG